MINIMQEERMEPKYAHYTWQTKEKWVSKNVKKYAVSNEGLVFVETEELLPAVIAKNYQLILLKKKKMLMLQVLTYRFNILKI